MINIQMDTMPVIKCTTTETPSTLPGMVQGVTIYLPCQKTMSGLCFRMSMDFPGSLAFMKHWKSKMVELQGAVTALAETNVNWKNFTFRDNWETLLQQSYSTLHFSHSSCDDGHHRPMQRGGTSMVCNHRLSAKLVDKGCDNPMDRWSWMKFWGKRGT